MVMISLRTPSKYTMLESPLWDIGILGRFLGKSDFWTVVLSWDDHVS